MEHGDSVLGVSWSPLVICQPLFAVLAHLQNRPNGGIQMQFSIHSCLVPVRGPFHAPIFPLTRNKLPARRTLTHPKSHTDLASPSLPAFSTSASSLADATFITSWPPAKPLPDLCDLCRSTWPPCCFANTAVPQPSFVRHAGTVRPYVVRGITTPGKCLVKCPC